MMCFKKVIWLILFLSIICTNNIYAVDANKAELQDIKVRTISGDRVQAELQFSSLPKYPEYFTMDEPEKFVFDFNNVKNNVDTSGVQQVNLGVLLSYQLLTVKDKTRLVFNVSNIVPMQVDVDNNIIVITLDGNVGALLPEMIAIKTKEIESFDFQRGDDGEGRLIVALEAEGNNIDFIEKDDKVFLNFKGMGLPERLRRNFNVKDFGTPIDGFKAIQKENMAVIELAMSGEHEKIAYQLGKNYIFEARPLSLDEKRLKQAQKFTFTGERISLNFQDIEVRSVLQLLADFTGINIVASDDVTGSVTLRLEQVPWDQALDFILKSKGLTKRESGNVLLIAPSEQMAIREQVELAAEEQAQVLSPLRSEMIRLNYANASDLEAIIKNENNSLLSPRGQISVDERTNTLLIRDTLDIIQSVRNVLEKLDIAVAQVEIEAQIVEVTDTFNDEMGINFGIVSAPQLGKYSNGLATGSASQANAQTILTNKLADPVVLPTTSLLGNVLSSGGLANVIGSLAVGRLPGNTLLNLELKALESENRVRNISNPKVTTVDKKTAKIETGQERGFVNTADTGNTITFKKAVLKLEVTPQITPDGDVILELNISNDSFVSTTTSDAGLNTTELTTSVLVSNGGTIVLGGVFKNQRDIVRTRVPYLYKLPVLGGLFRKEKLSHIRTELLIFITPRVIKNIVNKG